MFPRSLNLSLSHSFFLFGARGTGKSTLLKSVFASKEATAEWIDLLDLDEEMSLRLNPGILKQRILALPSSCTHVVIDEIQKIPALLDTVHWALENTSLIFVLTGSSARKLKAGGANLLAGRAFNYSLYPLIAEELGDAFVLDDALENGTLPKVTQMIAPEERKKYLRTYVQNYIKEEVWSEQIVRKIEPFQRFLEVASQSNTKMVNFASIARDVGTDGKTVASYFTILEDTFLGFLLPPFDHSFRKRLAHKPKFYFFDGGVARALSRTLNVPLVKKTSAYGEAFEQFIVNEIFRRCIYAENDYRLSYLRTKDDLEIDLVIERPGLPLLLVEIKSSENVEEKHATKIGQIAKELNAESMILCQENHSRVIGNTWIHPWQIGLQKALLP